MIDLKKTSISCFAIFVFNFAVIAQISLIDSLKNSINSSEGTVKVDLLNKLALAYKSSQLSERQKTIEQALNLATKLNYKKGIAEAQKNYGKYYMDSRQYELAGFFLNQSLHLFSEIKDSLKLSDVIHYIGDLYEKTGRNDSALFFFEKGLTIRKSLNDSAKIAASLLGIGLQYWNRGKFSESIKYFNEALEIRKKLNLRDAIASTLNALGSSYWKLGKYYKAMEYFQESYPIREETNDSIGKIISWNNIGSIYLKLGYFDKAESYFLQGLDYSKSCNYDFGIAYSLYNFGLLNLDKPDYDKALNYFFKSNEIAKELLNHNLRILILNYIGFIYEKKGDLAKALNNYNQGVALAKKSFDKYTEAILLQGLARIYIQKKDFQKALQCINTSQEFASSENILDLMKDNYYLLYDVNNKTNNRVQALEYHKLYADLQDTLYNVSIGNNLGNMIIKFEIAKTETEKQLLEKENRLMEQDKNYQVTLRNFFIAIAILVLVLLVVLYYIYRYRTKSSQRIEEQKINLEKLNEQLNEQNVQLKELNTAKDKLFSIIAHDLKSPFHSLLAFSQILNDELDTLSNEEIKQFSSAIHDSGMKMLNLVENLLNWARSQLQRIHVNFEEFSLNEVVNEAVNIYSKIARTKQIELINYSESNYKVFADKNMVDSVIRNLISNAIKFSDRGSKVEIETKDINDQIEIAVRDHGVGMNEDMKNNLFKTGQSISSRGTEKESGTGLGLQICKDFIEKNNGIISVESQVGVGSTFIIKLPKTCSNN